MSVVEKLKHELKSVAVVTLYFAVWLGALLLLKNLILVEYRLEVVGFSKAMIGALILAKVVLVLEHVPLGSWIRHQPAWVDVVARSALYTAGVVVVILLEKGVEGRHEHGSFVPALADAAANANAHQVWANTLCVAGALLVYNALTVIRGHLGSGGLIRLFLLPLRNESPSG